MSCFCFRVAVVLASISKGLRGEVAVLFQQKCHNFFSSTFYSLQCTVLYIQYCAKVFIESVQNHFKFPNITFPTKKKIVRESLYFKKATQYDRGNV